MKRKGYYLCSLLVMIFVFLSCRDEEQDLYPSYAGYTKPVEGK